MGQGRRVQGLRLGRPSLLYCLMGAVLGLGAPLGFLLLEMLLEQGEARASWVVRALADQRIAYAYMGVSTPVVFGLFGRALGRHEERLRASAAYLEQVREEFAAVVAHDLRSTIQVILLQIGVLTRGACDGEVRVPIQSLQRIGLAGERLARMVNDLLDASLIEASRLTLQPEVVSVAEVLRSLIDRLRPILGSRDVELRVEGRPPNVLGDPTRLDQIFGNLIENAAKYSSEDAPIVVSVRTSSGGALVRVTDRGSGIPPEDIPRLFDRFYQSKRARAKKSGLGLGLYIARGLVEAHGGRVEVVSRVGEGSTFSVWLPPIPPERFVESSARPTNA